MRTNEGRLFQNGGGIMVHLSGTHHLVIITTFALTIYHSLGLSLQTQNSSLSQILLSVVFFGSIWTAFTDLEPGPDYVGNGVVYAKLVNRIVSYLSISSDCNLGSDLPYFYRAMLSRARYCYGNSSVCLSVCLSVTLRYHGHM